MGIFLENIVLFNRAPIDLMVTFDGQTKTLVPGPNTVPSLVVGHAKNQNPIMGSQDPYNPHMSGARYLVGVVGSQDPVEPLTLAEWEEHLRRPCREDEVRMFEDKYGSDPKAKQVTYGKGRKTTASSRSEAGAAPAGISAFESKV